MKGNGPLGGSRDARGVSWHWNGGVAHAWSMHREPEGWGSACVGFGFGLVFIAMQLHGAATQVVSTSSAVQPISPGEPYGAAPALPALPLPSVAGAPGGLAGLAATFIGAAVARRSTGVALHTRTCFARVGGLVVLRYCGDQSQLNTTAEAAGCAGSQHCCPPLALATPVYALPAPPLPGAAAGNPLPGAAAGNLAGRRPAAPHTAASGPRHLHWGGRAARTAGPRHPVSQGLWQGQGHAAQRSRFLVS